MVGSTVRLLDSTHLPVGYWSFMADNVSIYYSGYSYGYYPENDLPVEDVMPYYGNEYIIGAYALNREGLFTDNQEIAVGQYWISLLGVQGDTAYISVNSAGIAQYDFSASPPMLNALTPVMGYPSKVRFGENYVYAPLGYSGTAVFAK